MAFWVYQLYIVSYFLHLTNRFPVLGPIRFDMLLFVFLVGAAVFDWRNKRRLLENEISKKLILLILFILISVPFVEWPGSVLDHGIKYFTMGTLFFFFTVFFVQTPKQFKIFIYLFLFCQTFRVLEPVYLHITTGYYGDFASTTGEAFLDRLSGAPNDVINPNGLAIIIDTIVPLYWYLSRVSRFHKWLAYAIIPVSVYALLLTGSRSGLVGFFVFCFLVWWRGRKKLLGVILGIVIIVVSLPLLSENMQERYLSIVSTDTIHSGTKQGRIEGWKRDFSVAMHKPLFGHGIGTSLEANVNKTGVYLVAHNLMFETWQEIGLIGLLFFSTYLYTIWKILVRFLAREEIQDKFALAMANGVIANFYVSLAFSVFSYGLSSYKWHFMGGVVVILGAITKKQLATQ